MTHSPSISRVLLWPAISACDTHFPARRSSSGELTGGFWANAAPLRKSVSAKIVLVIEPPRDVAAILHQRERVDVMSRSRLSSRHHDAGNALGKLASLSQKNPRLKRGGESL